MNKKIMLAGLASLALSMAAYAAPHYIGNASDGDLTTIINLGARSIRSAGVTTTYPSAAAFEAALGGSLLDATSTAPALWTWPNDDVNEPMIMEDNVFITNGHLFIPEGSVVRGQPRSGAPFDAGSLFIARGAKLLAAGSSSAPIVFTTAALNNAGNPGARASGANVQNFWDKPYVNGVLQTPKAPSNAGLWGGLIVLGNALTNADRLPATATQQLFDIDGLNTVATDDRFEIEGVPAGDAVTLGIDRFGGFATEDNSGVLAYLSLRHGGANIATANEINGLTLGAVGRGTTIHHIEVWGNTDDGIEIFGGSVNLDHVVVVAQQDDGLDLDVGYTGTIQFALVINSQLSDKLCEWDGSYETETSINGVSFAASGPVTASLLPVAQFTVANATLIGNNGGTNITPSGMHIRDQAAPRFVNSIVVNPSIQGTTGPIEFDNRSAGSMSTVNLLDKEVSYFKGITFFDTTATLTTVNGFVQNGSLSNTIARAKLSDVKFQNSFNVNPGFGSAVPVGALTSGLLFDPRASSAGNAVQDDDVFGANAAIQPVSYRGAFDANEATLWTADWTAADAYQLIIK